ncbi:MAG: hypothetical protein JST92_06765, partial [Deltaproteobacteria bacterium]|nr:hypothetical protein [Deltaproteobacteria bacterium]
MAALLVGFIGAFMSASGGACGDSTSSTSQPDGGTVCVLGSATCGAGTECVHGDCTPNCDQNTPCPDGFYCEGAAHPFNICSPKNPINCTTFLDCPQPQTCNAGLCTDLELRADGGNAGCILGGSSSDGCAPGALCFQTQTSTGAVVNRCVGLPHCSETGACPVGTAGSTCNVEPDGGVLFPGKSRICLFSLCRVTPDCPISNDYGQAQCFHPNPADDLGKCQYGLSGDQCLSAEDCFNSAGC